MCVVLLVSGLAHHFMANCKICVAAPLFLLTRALSTKDTSAFLHKSLLLVLLTPYGSAAILSVIGNGKGYNIELCV